MKLIGLTGYARSGKDTIGSRLVTEHGFVRVAFADAVRDATLVLNPIVTINSDKMGVDEWRVQDLVDLYGWEKCKTIYPEIRRLLQVMGTEVGRDIFGPSSWTDIALRKIAEYANVESLCVGVTAKIVVTDVRFANEADLIHDLGGQVWKVERSGFGPVNAHASEVLDFEVDYILDNDNDIKGLFSKVDALLRSIV